MGWGGLQVATCLAESPEMLCTTMASTLALSASRQAE